MSRTRWHYPRTELAERVYTVLAKGPVQGVSLFGPRRTGKTHFLMHDLAPLAEQRGHRVVYASLWQAIDSPLGILLYELDRALQGGSIWERIDAAAREIAPKFKLEVPGGGGTVEVDLAALKGKAPESHILLLDQLFARLANERAPAFLLLDEFQELTRSQAAAPLVAALRTSLDRRRDGIVAVFTGSSQTGLRAVFTARDAPFFRFASPVDLPALDDGFVDHQLGAFRATSRTEVRREVALDIFHRFDRSPLVFQRWLTTIALHPELGEEAAVGEVQAEIAAEFGFGRQWLSLTALQRATLRLIAQGVGRVGGGRGLDAFGALTGVTRPEAAQVQSALKRLERLRIADRAGGEWRLTDPIFAAWVRSRPASDF